MSGHHDPSEDNGDVPSAPARTQSYDPGRLLGDVMRLLAERGLSPVISTRDLRIAVPSCGSLLLCLGIVPTRRPDLTALLDPGDPRDLTDTLDRDNGPQP